MKQEFEFSTGGKVFLSVFSALMVIVFGAVLLLAALGKLGGADAGAVWLPALLFTAGCILAVNGVFTQSAVAVWLGAAALLCGAAVVIEVCAAFGYAELYPMFIAVPGLACLASLPFADSRAACLKAAAFFASIAGIFFLSSFDVLPLAGAVAVLVVIAGLFMLVYALLHRKAKQDDQH